MNCEATDCTNQRHGKKQYCRMHLARLKRTGTLGGFKAIYNYEKTCTKANCDKPYRSADNQLCEQHYSEYRKEVAKANTARLRAYDELLNPKTAGEIDYDDLWKWVEKEIA